MNPDVARLYDLAVKSSRAKEAKDEALMRGDTAAYFRALKDTPEHVYAQPLNAVRRQITTLAKERRRVAATGFTPHLEQLDAAMGDIAKGTLLWIDEKLGRPAPGPNDQGETG